MAPATHGLLSWLVAQAPGLDRRGRLLVLLAGLAPDLDGLGIIAQVLSGGRLEWFSDYHHVLCHNLLAALVCAGLCWWLSRWSWQCAVLALVAFHLHLLCDVAGSRGPDGHDWPIPYLKPFSDAWVWTWSGQWALNAWPNLLITAGAATTTLWLAWWRGFGPLEALWPRADAALVQTLRQRFGLPAHARAPAAELMPPG